MITQIGIAAGDIWHLLDEKGNATLEQLTQETGKTRDLILMSLGWLAREGHVLLEETGSSYTVTFQQKNVI